MHEHGIMHVAFHQAVEAAERAGAKRILVLNMVLCEGGHATIEAAQFHWEDIRRGSIAEDAVLNFRIVPAQHRCWECTEVFTGVGEKCPKCGSESVLPLPPDNELYLESIEAE